MIGLPVDARSTIADHDPVRDVGQAMVAVGAGVELHETAQLLGRCALGFASRVSSGACLRDTIIMPEAWVGPRCRLNRVVVGQGVEVPAGFGAERALICMDPGEGLLVTPFEPVPV